MPRQPVSDSDSDSEGDISGAEDLPFSSRIDRNTEEEQEDEEEDDEEEEDEEEMTFAERMMLQKRGALQAQHDFDHQEFRERARPAKRDNRNRPQEVTSKRPVGRFLQVVQPIKKKSRDPRFDELSGKFNQDSFDKAYSFLDDYRKDEMEQLKKKMGKIKDPYEWEKLKTQQSKLVSVKH